MNYSEWNEGLNFPFGLTVDSPWNFSLRPMYGGDRSHLILTYYYRQLSFSLLYVWYEGFGVAMSAGL